MTTSRELADRVAGEMTRAGETTYSLAKKTGIPNTTLRRRLVDGYDFTLLEIAKIADALNISPARLIPDEWSKAVAA